MKNNLWWETRDIPWTLSDFEWLVVSFHNGTFKVLSPHSLWHLLTFLTNRQSASQEAKNNDKKCSFIIKRIEMSKWFRSKHHLWMMVSTSPFLFCSLPAFPLIPSSLSPPDYFPSFRSIVIYWSRNNGKLIMEWISINHGHHSVQLILHPDRKPLYGWKWKILDCRLCHGIQLLMHEPAQERTTGEELQWLVIISTAPSSSPGRPLLPSIIICYDYPGLNKAFYVRSVFSILFLSQLTPLLPCYYCPWSLWDDDVATAH